MANQVNLVASLYETWSTSPIRGADRRSPVHPSATYGVDGPHLPLEPFVSRRQYHSLSLCPFHSVADQRPARALDQRSPTIPRRARLPPRHTDSTGYCVNATIRTSNVPTD